MRRCWCQYGWVRGDELGRPLDVPLTDRAVSARARLLDPPSQGRYHRMAGLDLLAAIVICWNSAHAGEAVRQRKLAGLTVEPELLAHISPLGWGHILLTREYRWPKRR